MSWEGLAPGALLAETYRIVRRIGEGRLAEVYEATHARSEGRHAVKVLPADLSGHPEALACFNRQAEIASSLRHPNIVEVTDFNVTPAGNPYLVMELLEGKELAQRLGRPLPLPWVLDVVGQTASALGAAHARGIVHCELKPQNLFVVALEGRDVVKVVDFGIFKVREAITQLTEELAIIGTPQYLAPEQAQGRRVQIDARADQFALAAITYEMLTGRAAFQGASVPSVLYQVVHHKPSPIAEANPAVSVAVQAVVERALAKNSDGRFASVREFHDELVRAASGQLPARVPTPEAPPSWPRRRTTLSGATGEAVTVPRRPPWLGLAVVLAAAGAGGVLWTAWPARYPSVPAATPAPAPDAAMASPDAVATPQPARAEPAPEPARRPRRKTRAARPDP